MSLARALVCPTLIATLLGATASHAATAQQVANRHALVIGNASYTIEPLANPLNDADLMAQTLAAVGFNVTKADNLSRVGFYKTLSAFTASLAPDDTALVYYAGHGLQIEETSYLVPVDMVPTSASGTAARGYALPALLNTLDTAGAAVNIVVLDACRNNPFLPTSGRTRAFEGLGLADVDTPRGTVVAYATAPGQLALDGSGTANSVYTEALAQAIRSNPSLPIELLLKQVGDSVRQQTLDEQQPWYESSLAKNFYFDANIVAGQSPTEARPGSATTGQARALASIDEPWWAGQTRVQWNQMDWEIQQRAQQMTKDEIPEMAWRAERGSVVAQTALGIMYRYGVEKTSAPGGNRGRFGAAGPGVVRSGANNSEAIRWLTKAVDAGYPVAQVELGDMMYAGVGVDRDRAAALGLYQQAAQFNYVRAELNVAQLSFGSNLDAASGQQMFDAIRSAIGSLSEEPANPKTDPVQ